MASLQGQFKSNRIPLRFKKPHPLGWGFLLLGGFVAMALHPQVERDFGKTLLAYGMAFIGYLGCLGVLFRKDPSPIPTSWKWTGLGLACLIRLTLFPVQPCDDLYRYAWEAKIQRAGFSVYQLAPADPQLNPFRDSTFFRVNHPTIPTVYPRFAQLLFQLGFSSNFNPNRSKDVFLWKSFLGFADLCSMAVLATYSWPAALIFGLHPLLVFEGVGRGHLEPIWLALCLAAWFALRRNWDLFFGAFLGLAISVKPMAVTYMFPWMLTKPWQRWSAYLASFLILVASLDAYRTIGETLSHFVNQTHYNSLLPSIWRFIMNAEPADLNLWGSGAWMTPVMLSLLGAGLFVVRQRHLGQWPSERCMLWLFASLLLTATVFHPWYSLWILPMAALRKSLFWLLYAATQIFGLWPYFQQSMGLPWQEIPGLKWWMLLLAVLMTLALRWKSFESQRLNASSRFP